MGNVFNVPRGPGAPPVAVRRRSLGGDRGGDRRAGRPTWCWSRPGSTPCSAIRSAASPSSPSTTPTSPFASASACPRRRSSGCSRAATCPSGWPRGCWRTCARSPKLRPTRGVRPDCARKPRPSPYRTGLPSSASPLHRRGPVAQQLHMEAEYLELRTKHPFIIARGGQSDYRTIWVRLRDADGQRRAGARRRPRGSTARRRRRCWRRSTCTSAGCRTIRSTSRRPSAAGSRCSASTPRRGRRCPAALHDLVGKRLGVPVYRLWGLDPAKAPRSTFTIGLDTPERIRLKVREADQYPILKIKLGTDRDVEILRSHPRRDRQGDPGRRQLRLDREAGHRDAAGAARSSGSPCWSSRSRPTRSRGLAEISRRADHSGHRRRELPHRGRHPAAGRRGGRHQHQAGQVRQPARGAPDDRGGAGARHDGDGRAA